MKFWSKCREAIYVLRRRARLEGPTTVSLWAPVEEGVPDAWWSTCAPWGSSPFTGKPYHPTTQGKNERFGQTLFRYLDQQPLAAFIAELQDQVDRFDLVYNTQRPHQGLPGRITGQALGRHRGGPGAPTGSRHRPYHPRRLRPSAGHDRTAPGASAQPIGATGERELTIGRNGTVHIGGIAFLVNRHLAASTVIAIWDTSTITFADPHGEVLIQYTRPPQGTSYVSHHPPDPTNRRGGRGRKRP